MTAKNESGGVVQPSPTAMPLGPAATWIGLAVALIGSIWGLAIKPVEDRLTRLEVESEKRQTVVAQLQINNAQFSVHVQKLAEAVNKLADRIEDDDTRKK